MIHLLLLYYLFLYQENVSSIYGGEKNQFNVFEKLSIRENPKILVFPSVDLFNGQTVAVMWSGIVNPKFSDEIGLYCPHNLAVEQYVRRYPIGTYTNSQQSFGSMNITLFYSRSNCQIRYLTLDNKTKIYAVTWSSIISFRENEDTPLAIHISLTNTPDEMRIMWTSGSYRTPCVFYGKKRNYLHDMEYGSSVTYRVDDMCEPPATTFGFIDPGFLHDVLLTNLDHDCVYFYVVGNGYGNSTVQSFRSPPSTLSFRSTSFIVYGDLHITPYPGAYSTIGWMNYELMNDDIFDMILHIGGLSYASGIAYDWEEFGFLIETIASKVAYMVSVGNHEQNHVFGIDKDPSGPGGSFHPSWGNYLFDSGGECGLPTVKRYHMPDNGHQIWWYSFDYSMVHVLQFSTEHDFTEGSQQYNWIEKDLASVDRSRTPWLVVTGHRPMYSSANDVFVRNISLHMRQSLEKLFRKYKVDFAFWGHVHAYERTCPVYAEQCVSPDYSSEEYGTVHFVVGAAGKLIEDFDFQKVSWTKIVECRYGYGRMNFVNKTIAVWKWRRNEDGIILDQQTYYRYH